MSASTRLAAATAALALLIPSLAAAGEPTADAPAGKSPSTALALAATGAVVGLAAGPAGATMVVDHGSTGVKAAGFGLIGVASVGPALGHLYAGEIDHAVITSGLRAGAIAAIVIGGDNALSSFDCHEEYESCPDGETNAAIALVGAGVLLGTTAYDLWDAPRAARRHRARALAIAPTALSAKDGPAPGLTIAGQF